jgi:myo-inositol-1-phosphate synthase
MGFSLASKPIAVAVVGVGNCASSFAQAVAAGQAGTLGTAGVAHPFLGDYGIGDIDIVAAFDVDARKVGRDLAEAITAMPNCTSNHVSVAPTGVVVRPGPVADGVPARLAATVEVCDEAMACTGEKVTAALRESDAEVLVSYLPTGSRLATACYAEAALSAEVGFINCNPEPVAGDPAWRARFAKSGVPLLGDDIRSQLGATRVHQAILDLCQAVGVVPSRTYQFNHGGNTDFLNMSEPARAASKKRSKEGAIGALLPAEAAFAAGPSGYVSFLGDQKVAYIRVEGSLLLGAPFSMEVRLQVEDSPNSAGVVLDAVRAARIARDRGQGGAITDVCPYLFKSPPERCADQEATLRFEAFGRGADMPDGQPVTAATRPGDSR